MQRTSAQFGIVKGIAAASASLQPKKSLHKESVQQISKRNFCVHLSTVNGPHSQRLIETLPEDGEPSESRTWFPPPQPTSCISWRVSFCITFCTAVASYHSSWGKHPWHGGFHTKDVPCAGPHWSWSNERKEEILLPPASPQKSPESGLGETERGRGREKKREIGVGSGRGFGREIF